MPTEIIPDLWIGNRKDIENTNFLKANNIRYIINCTRDLEFNSKYQRAENVRIPVDDHPAVTLMSDNINLYSVLDEYADLIHQRLARSEGVLVFCYAGRQRSATVVAAYLIKYGRVGKEKAMNYIMSKRSKCFTPSANFEMALGQFENDLGGVAFPPRTPSRHKNIL